MSSAARTVRQGPFTMSPCGQRLTPRTRVAGLAGARDRPDGERPAGALAGARAAADRGKHPRVGKWREVATTDPKTIRDWRARWPNGNFGIVTGPYTDPRFGPTNLVVIDIDGPAGESSLTHAFAMSEICLEPTYEVSTGKGRHVYYVSDFACSNGNSGLRAIGVTDVDVRGDGGYVIAPGSRHHTGRIYTAQVRSRCPGPSARRVGVAACAAVGRPGQRGRDRHPGFF